MNLKRYATCIIFLWLPLATLQLINKNKKTNDQRLNNHQNAENILSNHIEKKKENMEIIKKETEERGGGIGGIESLFEIPDNKKIDFSRNRASEISPNESSANNIAMGAIFTSSVIKSNTNINNNKTEPKNNRYIIIKTDKSAQEKLTHSVKKDLSALNVINFLRTRNNRSAVVPLPKYEKSVVDMGIRRRKRETFIKIPNDSNFNDDDDDDERSVLDDDIEDLDEDEDETNTTGEEKVDIW